MEVRLGRPPAWALTAWYAAARWAASCWEAARWRLALRSSHRWAMESVLMAEVERGEN